MNKLVNLQILRGVAASFVVVDHAMEALISRGFLDARWSELAWFFGWLGVVVFFAISGFIMVRSTPSGDNAAGTAAGFLARRIIRVVPLYWMSTALYLFLKTLRGKPFDIVALVKSVVFIPYLEPGATDMRPIVGQGWTLNYEMYFYLMFAICLIPRPKLGTLMFFASFIALVSCRSLLMDTSVYAVPQTPLQFWTDPILLFFACGAAVGHMEKNNILRRELICRCAFQRPLLTSCILLGLNVMAFSVSGFVFSLPYSAQLMFGIAPIVAVVICTVDCAGSDSRARSLLSRAGDASYSTYLIHPLAIIPLMAIYGKLPAVMQSPVVFVFAAVMVSTIVGLTVFSTVEKPTTAILRRALSNSPLDRWLHLSRNAG